MLSELWNDLRYRVRALVRRDAMEHDLEAELAFHIEREAEKYQRLGVPPDEARRRARIAFGSMDDAKEQTREARGTVLMEIVVRDALHAVRSFRKQPAFTAAVLLTLAIGIGANTTVFTLLDALVLRPLPVAHPERLVTIGDPRKVHWGWHGSPMVDYVSYPVYEDIRAGTRTLSGVYATGDAGAALVAPGGSSGEPEHPTARFVSGNFFSVLEVPAFGGRTLTDADDSPGAPPATVISDGYWRRRFGGERSVLGSTVTINGVAVTIVGITPPGFTGDVVGETTDLWLPIALQPVLDAHENRLNDRTSSWLLMMGRLAPGATLAQARAELPSIELRSIRAQLSGFARADFDHDILTDPVSVEPGARGFSAQRAVYSATLVVLMVAVGLVVLVVCANVANLMLARAVARGRELSLRMTLGASRRRLASQLMTESVLLGVVGGALGMIAAVWATRVLLAVMQSRNSPMLLDVHPDLRVLAFTVAVTMLCVAGFGLGPAVRATRVDLATALRAQGRAVVGARARLRRTLVVAQIALSMLLLMGSGLLVRSMRQLLRADLGLDRDHLVLVHVAARNSQLTGARLQALRDGLAHGAASLPGIAAAAYAQDGIFSGGQSLGHLDIPGVVAEADSTAAVKYDRVGPGYARALGATVLAGRDINDADETSGSSALLNATAARAYFPRGGALGRSVVLDSETYTVVGVVADLQQESVRAAPVRRVYLSRPEPGAKPFSFELIVRTQGDPTAFVAPLRRTLTAVAAGIPVSAVPLDDRIRDTIGQDLVVTRVTTFFGTITLVLAALGLYGVVAYSTGQRTSEFGLRVALGAQPGRVSRMILGEGAALAAIGVVVGLPTGLLGVRLIRDRLFGVSEVDAPSLGAAVLVLVGAALLASYLPARRAARVSPLEALRAE